MRWGTTLAQGASSYAHTCPLRTRQGCPKRPGLELPTQTYPPPTPSSVFQELNRYRFHPPSFSACPHTGIKPFCRAILVSNAALAGAVCVKSSNHETTAVAHVVMLMAMAGTVLKSLKRRKKEKKKKRAACARGHWVGSSPGFHKSQPN